MKKGFIYLCKTAVKGVYKIGQTDDLKKRKYILESTGYYNINGLNLIFAVASNDMNSDENFIKELLRTARIRKSELYMIDEEIAIELLCKIGVVVYPENKEIAKGLEDEAKEKISSDSIPDGTYTCVTKVDGVEYNAILEMKDNQLTLKIGSKINEKYERLNDSYKNVRKQMNVNNGILVEDFEVSSVSCAASVVVGHLKNGWDTWKDSKGDKIDKYR